MITPSSFALVRNASSRPPRSLVMSGFLNGAGAPSRSAARPVSVDAAQAATIRERMGWVGGMNWGALGHHTDSAGNQPRDDFSDEHGIGLALRKFHHLAFDRIDRLRLAGFEFRHSL